MCESLRPLRLGGVSVLINRCEKVYNPRFAPGSGARVRRGPAGYFCASGKNVLQDPGGVDGLTDGIGVEDGTVGSARAKITLKLRDLRFATTTISPVLPL